MLSLYVLLGINFWSLLARGSCFEQTFVTVQIGPRKWPCVLGDLSPILDQFSVYIVQLLGEEMLWNSGNFSILKKICSVCSLDCKDGNYISMGIQISALKGKIWVLPSLQGTGFCNTDKYWDKWKLHSLSSSMLLGKGDMKKRNLSITLSLSWSRNEGVRNPATPKCCH